MGCGLRCLPSAVTLAVLACGQVEHSAAQGYTIDPEALEGCRSPDEPGCDRCDPFPEPSNCGYLFWEDEFAEPDESPWYNAGAMVEIEDFDVCTYDYPPCARCTLHDEAALPEFEEESACDCSEVAVDLQYCPAPDCTCYCKRRANTFAACPPAQQ